MRHIKSLVIVFLIFQVACEGRWQTEILIGDVIPGEEAIALMELPMSPSQLDVDSDFNLYISGQPNNENDEDFAQGVRQRRINANPVYPMLSDRIYKVHDGFAYRVLGSDPYPRHVDNGHLIPFLSRKHKFNVSDFEIDNEGNMVIADFIDRQVFIVHHKGYAHRLFGNPTTNRRAFDIMGAGSSQEFPSKTSIEYPTTITKDNEGNVYVGTYGSAVHQYEHESGRLHFLAGDDHVFENTFYECVDQEGPAIDARFPFSVSGLAHDRNGNIYILSGSKNVACLHQYDPSTRNITHLAGALRGSAFRDGINRRGSAPINRIDNVLGFDIDNQGNLFFTETFWDQMVRFYSPIFESNITIAGNNNMAYGGEGPAFEENLNQPQGTAVGRNGDVFFVDAGSRRVLKVRIDNVTGQVLDGASIQTVAQGQAAPEPGQEEPIARENLTFENLLEGTSDIETLVEGQSRILLSHLYEGSVWQYNTQTQISSVVIGVPEGLEDGSLNANQRPRGWHEDDVPALRSRLLVTPTDMIIDRQHDRMLVPEVENHSIRLVTMHDPADPSSWSIRTVFGIEGEAREFFVVDRARLNLPLTAAFHPDGDTVFVVEEGRNLSIRICSIGSGQCDTLRLSRGQNEYLNWPQSMLFHDGHLWVADTARHRVVKIDISNGWVTRVAGTGEPDFDSETVTSQAGSIPIPYPQKLLLQENGSLVIVGPAQVIKLASLNAQTDSTELATVLFRANENAPLPADNEVANLSPLRFNAIAETTENTFYLVDGANGMMTRLAYETP